MHSSFRIKKNEKIELQKISKRGSTPTRVSNRCKILLNLHRGFNVDESADRVGVSTATVKRVRRHYNVDGLQRAIYDAPKPGRPKQVKTKEEKELIALACTSPPPGYSRWTIRLLAQKSNRGYGTVQRILSEDGLKPWREKNVVHPRNNR